MADVLRELEQVLEARREASADDSYVASLHGNGLNKILEKVGEESIEVILAAKEAELAGDKKAVVAETADLWFHCMVMLSHLEISTSEVLTELQSRFGVSGHAEKAARGD